MNNNPLVLCILDGVGINLNSEHNAVVRADMPCFTSLLAKYPHSILDASGPAVGLPPLTMGNSEVGHITIGAGRIVNQFLQRFALENWDTNPYLKHWIQLVQHDNGIVHVAGLMSDGRVHSDINDILLIIKKIILSGLRVCLHFIADGRDTPPQSAQKYIDLIKNTLKSEFDTKMVFWGTLSGRYWTMDRNKNMDRTELAFNAIAKSESELYAPDIDSALQIAYSGGETDEFIKPIVITKCPINPQDGFLFGNYRSDRARQIVRAILTTGAHMLCFSQYGEGLNEKCEALLPDVVINNTLGDVLEQNGLRQLRIAETEKYNHVTYFFDAERNVDFKNENKILIPSPNVPTFDLKPEMSANEITDNVIRNLSDYDVVIVNYANGDMIGHTGNEQAAITAMEVLDKQLSVLVPEVLKLHGTLLIIADHGNAEQMWDFKNNAPWTAHTTNPVNCILVGDNNYKLSDGGLADVAPTVLKLLGIPQPTEMTGKSLI